MTFFANRIVPSGRIPPGRMLENDPIAVRILESDTLLVPIWVVRRDRLEACAAHARNGS